MAWLREGSMTLTWVMKGTNPLFLSVFCIRRDRIMGGNVLDFFSFAGYNLSISAMPSGGFKKNFYWGSSNYAKLKAFLGSRDQNFFLLFCGVFDSFFSISFFKIFLPEIIQPQERGSTRWSKIWLLILISRQNRNGHSHTFLVDTHVSWIRLFG